MLTVVGAGPGSLEYLPPIAVQAIKEAEIVIGAKRLLDKLAAFKCEKVYLKEIGYSPQKLLTLANGKKAVLLVSGDPGLFSLTKKITNLTREIKIIPGISSAQLLCARLAKSWEQVSFISLHGQKSLAMLNVIKPKQEYIVFLDSEVNWQLLSEQLKKKVGEKNLYIGVDLGLPSEKLIKTTVTKLSTVKLKKRQLALLFISGAENGKS